MLSTYCMINDIHNFVVFKSKSVFITELDNEGINKQKEYKHNDFVDFVNENDLHFYDWEEEE